MNEKTIITRGRATGHIEVKTYEPQAYEEPADGPNLVEIHVTETFSGDIVGEGRQHPRKGASVVHWSLGCAKHAEEQQAEQRHAESATDLECGRDHPGTRPCVAR